MRFSLLPTLFLLIASLPVCSQVSLEGEGRKWHRISLTFDGPYACETDSVNPFLDYRMEVTFVNGPVSMTVPGFFAADGMAEESSAECGDKWRVHFSPPRKGTWTWTASFVSGSLVAVQDTVPFAPTAFDGDTGSFVIRRTNKSAPDFRGQGQLRYVGKRYLQFAESKEYFLHGGSASPENILAYHEFDSTYTDVGPTDDDVHDFAPHVMDWNPGDPSWQGGKGQGIIGAMNYMASEEMNTQFILLFTEGGDGDDVWPWRGPRDYLRYDVSKLSQWEILFSHMDSLGISQHLVFQERENDQYIDSGYLYTTRKLYYREILARFGHHLGVVWNLGEENTNTDAQRKEQADFIRALDAYDHLTVAHTYAFEKELVYTPLLGYPSIDGASMHIGSTGWTAPDFGKWAEASDTAGRPWVLFMSEIGPATDGVLPDFLDSLHDGVRVDLWKLLFHEGSGTEWYFGRNYPENDVTCNDYRSRDLMWDQTRIALDFWRSLPFTRMETRNDLVDRWNTFCYALENKLYAVLLPTGDYTNLTLTAGDYRQGWFDTRTGGAIIDAGTFTLAVDDDYRIENPPYPGDWVGLVLKTGSSSRLENMFEQSTALNIHPNPSSSYTSLSWPEGKEEAIIRILDQQGRLIEQLSSNSANLQLDVSNYSEGVYWVEIQQGVDRFTQSMLIAR
jgi:hypothetical protein